MFGLMLADAIFGAFVSEVISSCADITKEKIRKAVKDRRNKYQNTEYQIYKITVNVLNQITCSNYKDKEFLFDTAAELLEGLKDNNIDNLDAVRNALNKIVGSIDNYKCNEFIVLLYHELSKEEHCELYKNILLKEL